MIYDCYNIRFNTANQTLEMNTGNETWIPVPSSGGGSPAGASGDVQYNNSGSFGGSDSLSWDEADTLLRVPNVSGQPSGDLVLGGFDGGTNTLSLPFSGPASITNTSQGVQINTGLAWSWDIQGFLGLPGVNSTQRDGMTAPAGALIYNSTTNKLNFYNGAAWEAVTSAAV